MNHFNRKSLLFYGSAISLVVILFSLVTSYGNAHLKAPDRIGGRYKFAAQDLPGCLKSNQLILLVQQSGAYVNGALLSEDVSAQAAKMAEERPSLNGQWNNQQLSLQGSLQSLPNCQGQVSIQGTIDQTTLNGTVSVDSSGDKATFTAQREADQSPSQKSTH